MQLFTHSSAVNQMRLNTAPKFYISNHFSDTVLPIKHLSNGEVKYLLSCKEKQAKKNKQ